MRRLKILLHDGPSRKHLSGQDHVKVEREGKWKEKEESHCRGKDKSDHQKRA